MTNAPLSHGSFRDYSNHPSFSPLTTYSLDTTCGGRVVAASAPAPPCAGRCTGRRTGCSMPAPAAVATGQEADNDAEERDDAADNGV